MPFLHRTSVKVAKIHPLQGLWEGLESDPGFLLNSMFGGKALYLDGMMMLFFGAKEEPWRGVVVCTDQTRHAALIKDFPLLSPHPVLSKWLYLSESSENFETVAVQLVKLAGKRDPRIGILPKTKKQKKPKSLSEN